MEATYPNLINTTDLGTYTRTVAARWRKPVICDPYFDNLSYTTSVRPQQYLTFAQQDLRLGNTRGAINALAHSKRAIDCQMSDLLQSLGLTFTGNFPSKVSKLEALGIVAPRILTKVTRARNALEHEWRKPTLDEAGDAVDVATLFLAAVQPLFVSRIYMRGCWVIDEESPDHDLYIPHSPTIYRTAIHLDSYSEDGCIQFIIAERGVLLAEQWIDSSSPIFVRLQAFLAKPRAVDCLGYLCKNEARQFLGITRNA